MEKRWIYFFLIVFAGWLIFYQRTAARYKSAEEAEAAAARDQLAQIDSAPGTPDTAPQPRETRSPDATAAPPEFTTPPSNSFEEDVEETVIAAVNVLEAPTHTVETRLQRIVFSELGAVPVEWEMYPSEFAEAPVDPNGEEVKEAHLIPQLRNPIGHEFPFQFEGRRIRAMNSVLFETEISTEEDGTQLARFTSPLVDGFQVIKTYRFAPESYLATLQVEIRNGPTRLYIGKPGEGWGIGWQGGFMNPVKQTRMTGRPMAVASVSNELRLKTPNRNDQPITYDANVAWAGHERKYYMAVIVPDPLNPADNLTIDVRQRNITEEYVKGVADPISVVIGHEFLELQPGATAVYNYRIFAGPKNYEVLKSTEVAMIDQGLALSSVAFGQMPLKMNWIRPICLFLLKALRWFEGLVHNWGLAIILLVLVVKTVLYPLSHWAIKNQAKTMAEQKKIKPFLDEINKKYKDNPQKRSQEMMKLYREHGINPLGAMRGCFPMLLQMPIFFALYILLDQAIELRGQEFLWIKDLSGPDRLIPFGDFTIPLLGWDALNILPILMATSQYFTSRLMATNMSDPMQKQMMTLMPVFFMFLLYNLPSGLMLYWTVQNIWQIGHTVLTKRYVAAHDQEPPGGSRVSPRTAKATA